MNINEYVLQLCKTVKDASRTLSVAKTSEKNKALELISQKLQENKDFILEENTKDLSEAEKNGIPSAMMDRLKLNDARIESICQALEQLCALPDPIGKGTQFERPNGLKITKLSVPLGVIAIIYESRPNVTFDAAALCIKTGNAVVLRGGKEAINTNRAIVKVMKLALAETAISPDVVAMIDDTSREGTNALMTMRGYVDVLIPRGGKSLIRAVCENSKVPVIETGAGNCHIYIDSSADLEKSLKVALNSKLSRPSVCNATETMLVHQDIADKFLPMFSKAIESSNLEMRGCEKTQKILPNISPAAEEDYETEFNDYILAIKVVGGTDEAIDHICRYGTSHSEAIMTESLADARKFCERVDAAAVYVNASTRFTDGGEFGFGAEIGISTQKLHTRGPMGPSELTTVKYVVEGDGQIR